MSTNPLRGDFFFVALLKLFCLWLTVTKSRCRRYLTAGCVKKSVAAKVVVLLQSYAHAITFRDCGVSKGVVQLGVNPSSVP